MHLLGHSTFPGYVGMVEELFVRPDRRRRRIGRMLVERALRRLAAVLARVPRATAATGVELGFSGDERWLNCVRPRRPLVRDVWPDVLAGLWITGAGRSLFRTDVLRRAGSWDESVCFGEDDELWLRLAPRGPVAVVTDDVLLYRDHTNRPRPPAARRTERAFRGPIRRRNAGAQPPRPALLPALAGALHAALARA